MIRRTRAELWLFSVTLIWGSTFVFSKILLEDVSPFVYITIRFGTASLIFPLFFLRRMRRIPASAIVDGGILGALLFVGFATQTVGMLYTTASKSAFITGMMVVFTPICQLLIEKRPPHLGNLIGVAIVTVGLYLLTSPSGSAFTIGDGLTLVCAVLFGVYLVYMDIFGKRQDPAHLTLMQFATTAVLGAVSVLVLETPRLDPTPHAGAIVAYMVLFPTIIALYVQAKYQRDTTPTRSALIFSVEPVIAAGFAYLLLDERLGVVGAVGGALILTGLLVSELWDVLFRTRREEQEGDVRDVEEGT